MTVSTGLDQSRGELPSWAAILVLLTATLGMLVPFLDKPFHIDDPLFVWAAKHIRENIREGRNPGDFFGFDVNWNGVVQPMHRVTQNPPLACYALAAASYITGWNERGLHAVFLIPAAGVVLGTWTLARRVCGHPVLAALTVCCSPIFLVSSTNVMCDTLMTCFWVWAVVLWIAGLDRNSHWRLACSAILMGLAALTKYFGLCLIPLLMLYTLTRSLRFSWRLAWLLIPVLCMWGYQEWTKHLYEHGMLSGAAEYATTYYRQKSTQHWSVKPVATFTFTGGCLLCLLFYVPSLVRYPWRTAGAGLGLALLLAGWLHFLDFKYLKPAGVRSTTWDITLQAGLLIVLGLGICALTLADLRHTWREGQGLRQAPIWRASLADSLLLFAWVGGTMLFTGYINWTVNARSVLPLVPAAAILMCRRIDWISRGLPRGAMRLWPVFQPLSRVWTTVFQGPPSLWHALPLLPAAALTLLIAQADYVFAWDQRKAAEEISAMAQRMPGIETEPGKFTPRKLWFVGHWGYQYYMEQAGIGTAVGYRQSSLNKGDLFAIPVENMRYTHPSKESCEMVRPLKFDLSPWVTTHSRIRRAGFYSDRWGPLPFVFGDEWQSGPVEAEPTNDPHKDTHYLLRLTQPLMSDGAFTED